MSPYDLAETPGAFYAIAYWMSSIFFMKLNSKKSFDIKFYLNQTVFLLLILFHMEILTKDVPAFLFIPSILLSIGIMLFFIYKNSDLSFQSAGYYTARAFILGEFLASLIFQIYYFLVLDVRLTFGYASTYIFIFCGYTLLLSILYIFEKRFVEEAMQYEITSREILSVVIISAVVFLMSNISYVYKNTPFSGSMARDIYNIRTMVDFGGVALLFAYHIQLKEMKANFEAERLENLLRLHVANYEISEKSIEIVNQKYHDLKHQIIALKKDVVSEEAIRYLNKMEDDIRIYELQNKTGNRVLDIVLMGKQLSCQDDNITFTIIADGNSLNFMDSVDISTLFGNILDNAIESVKKIQDEEKRLIHLTISRKKQFLRIRLENCYQGEIVFNKGLPVTTKKDKNFHGYGLKSIQETVRKYEGTMAINAENGWFELRLLFPLNM